MSKINNIYSEEFNINEINNDLTINGNLNVFDIVSNKILSSGLITSDLSTNNINSNSINSTKLNNLIVGSHNVSHNKSIVHSGRTLEDQSSENKAVEMALGAVYNPAILFPVSFLPSSSNPLQLVHTKHLDENLLTKSLFINGQIGLDIEALNNLGSSVISSIDSLLLQQLTDGTVNINVNAFLNNTSTKYLQVRNLSNPLTSSTLSKITARDSNNNIINNIHYLAPNLFITTDAQGYLINPLNAPFNNYDDWKTWKTQKDAEKLTNDLKNTEQDTRLTVRETKDLEQDGKILALENKKIVNIYFNELSGIFYIYYIDGSNSSTSIRDSTKLDKTQYELDKGTQATKDLSQDSKINELTLDKLDKSIYNTDKATQLTKDLEQDTKINELILEKLDKTTYNTDKTTQAAKDLSQDTQINALSLTKLDKTIYDANKIINDGKFDSIELKMTEYFSTNNTKNNQQDLTLEELKGEDASYFTVATLPGDNILTLHLKNGEMLSANLPYYIGPQGIQGPKGDKGDKGDKCDSWSIFDQPIIIAAATGAGATAGAAAGSTSGASAGATAGANAGASAGATAGATAGAEAATLAIQAELTLYNVGDKAFGAGVKFTDGINIAKGAGTWSLLPPTVAGAGTGSIVATTRAGAGAAAAESTTVSSGFRLGTAENSTKSTLQSDQHIEHNVPLNNYHSFNINNNERLKIESNKIKIGSIDDIETTINNLNNNSINPNNFYTKSEVNSLLNPLHGLPSGGNQGYGITWNSGIYAGQGKVQIRNYRGYGSSGFYFETWSTPDVSGNMFLENTIKLEQTGQDENIALQSWVNNNLTNYYNKSIIDSTFNN